MKYLRELKTATEFQTAYDNKPLELPNVSLTLDNSKVRLTEFLKEHLHLEVQQGKTLILSSNQGVEFLGGYIKPYRVYVSNSTIRRINIQMSELHHNTHKLATINSFLGIMSHYKSYNLRAKIISDNTNVQSVGLINDKITKIADIPILIPRIISHLS